jgi:hypothetical protein
MVCSMLKAPVIAQIGERISMDSAGRGRNSERTRIDVDGNADVDFRAMR